MLIVDDDQDDVDLLRSVINDVDLPVQVRVVKDGAECLERLPGMHPRPEIILLDLEMPRIDGRETLRLLKQDVRFRHIPVVIFTNSDDPYHVHDCYENHAAAYVTKPMRLEEYRDLVCSMDKFWFGTATLCGD